MFLNLCLLSIKIQSFNVHKARNLRSEHFESDSSFSYVPIALYIRCSGPVGGYLNKLNIL